MGKILYNPALSSVNTLHTPANQAASTPASPEPQPHEQDIRPAEIKPEAPAIIPNPPAAPTAINPEPQPHEQTISPAKKESEAPIITGPSANQDALDTISPTPQPYEHNICAPLVAICSTATYVASATVFVPLRLIPGVQKPVFAIDGIVLTCSVGMPLLCPDATYSDEHLTAALNIGAAGRFFSLLKPVTTFAGAHQHNVMNSINGIQKFTAGVCFTLSAYSIFKSKIISSSNIDDYLKANSTEPFVPHEPTMSPAVPQHDSAEGWGSWIAETIPFSKEAMLIAAAQPLTLAAISGAVYLYNHLHVHA